MASHDEITLITTHHLHKLRVLLPNIDVSDNKEEGVRKRKSDRVILEDLPPQMIDTVIKLTAVQEEPTEEPVPSLRKI